MDDLEPSKTRRVALRKESVDRNVFGFGAKLVHSFVALRKESVDRNSTDAASLTVSTTVALRKESVDRNWRKSLTERRH